MLYTEIVNKNKPYKKKTIELVETLDKDNNKVLLEKETFNYYEQLKKYLKTIGIEIVINEAYRSIEDQEKIVEEFKNIYDEDILYKKVAVPGYSEHHTGLAIDIGLVFDKKEEEEENIKIREALYQEMHKHLSKFGFILRYPKGKEEITGYSYEPWHIRYVGIIPATIIYQNNLTLEEYLKDFAGILYINKPKDVTSFDVVHEISKLFGIKKVGHTGTLDPLATGVMLVAVGKATKIVELLTAEDKEYIARVKLGIMTDTYDITGKVIEKKEVPKNLNLEKTIFSFQKTYLQEVPIYSAVKVNGKKLYEYAREGKKIELPKKEVTIKKIELLDKNQDEFTMKALVTKGCYIRSLIMDIGKSMNTYATMTSLTRTKQGRISIEESNTLEEIKNNHFQIHKIEEVLTYPVIQVSKEEEFMILNGVKIKDKWNIYDKVIVQTEKGQLIGICQKENGFLKTWKNFKQSVNDMSKKSK